MVALIGTIALPVMLPIVNTSATDFPSILPVTAARSLLSILITRRRTRVARSWTTLLLSSMVGAIASALIMLALLVSTGEGSSASPSAEDWRATAQMLLIASVHGVLFAAAAHLAITLSRGKD